MRMANLSWWKAKVTAHTDNVVTIDSDGGNPPVPTFPWLIEFPNRTAQLFRVLGVGQEAEGVYEISALSVSGGHLCGSRL